MILYRILGIVFLVWYISWVGQDTSSTDVSHEGKRVWHITDGHRWFIPKKCKRCQKDAMEISDEGIAICSYCGNVETSQ